MASKIIIPSVILIGIIIVVLLFISSISCYKKVHKPKEVKKGDSLEIGRTFVECELGEKPEK